MFYKDKFKAIRTHKKISRKRLADQLGKSQQIIYYWETGQRKPGDSDIRVMAGILGVQPSDFSDLKDIGISLSKNSKYDSDPNSDLNLLESIINDFDGINSKDIAAIRDIKDRIIEVSAENARLTNRLNRYESIINSLSPIIYVKNKNFKYKLVNSSFINTLKGEYTFEDIIGSKATDIYGFKEISELLKHEQVAFNTRQKVSNKQIRIPRTYKIGLLSIVPRLDDHGDVIEIVCSIKDITDLSEALDILHELETAMNMIDQAVWIAVYNNEKNKYLFTYITRNLTDIHNVSIKKLNLDFSEWENSVFRPDKKSFHKWFSSDKYPKYLEYRIVGSDGDEKWVSSKISKVNNTIIGVVTDLTSKRI